ncbi:DUF4097 family beta strand repeat-containing protein [Nakamurella leprariae]|nr:DUF4097 family beta strand repeat-containing protein [Nakamurella leprariae]
MTQEAPAGPAGRPVGTGRDDAPGSTPKPKLPLLPIALGAGAAGALTVALLAGLVLSIVPAWHSSTSAVAAVLSGNELRISADRADVVLVPASAENESADTAVAQLRGRYSVHQPTVTASYDGEVTDFTVNCPSQQQCEGTVTVAVPSGVQVSVATTAGAITAQGMPNELQLGSQLGAITVTAPAEALIASTTSGNVVITDAASDAVAVQTASGTVTASFVEEPSLLGVTTYSGTVDLALAGGPYAVDTTGVRAPLDITVATTESAAASRVVVVSTTGAVTLRAAG